MRKKQLLKAGISMLLASAMVFTSVPVTSQAAEAGQVDTVYGAETTESLTPGYYLTVFSTTTNFYASADNVAQETRGVYMAVSKDGKTFEVLNNNGPIIYAKQGTKQVASPQIYKRDDNFAVIAPDSTASRGYHVFTSEDGVHYYKETIEESTDEYDSEAPLDKTKFSLMYKGENILEKDAAITLGNAWDLTEEEYTYIVNKLGTVVQTGWEPISVTAKSKEEAVEKVKSQYQSLNATYSDGSVQKFNLDFSNVEGTVDGSKPGTYTLYADAIQTKYLNNLAAINGSELPEDDPTNDSDTELDNYDEENEIVYYDNTKFVEGMADPNIFYDEQTGYYYMTGSYFPQEGDDLEGEELDLSATSTDQYSRVVLRRGRTLEELQDRSKQVVIWKAGNQGFNNNQGNDVAKGYRYIWAPEIHRVGDYWVVYFTESHSTNLMDIYCHALVLPGDKDPYETALKAADGVSEWKDYQMRGGTGLTKAITNNFCLDMTYFEDAANEEPYVIWASKGYGNSTLYMAQVDKEQPWVLTSKIIELTTPEYGWENVRYIVNEGPTVLQKDGKIFMCFSASGTGSEYAIGMMTAEQGLGEDLLDINNWTKNPYPLLTSRDVDGEEGPGHNSFTVDKDGNAIFVYHARPTSHNYQHCGWDGEKSLHYNSEPLNDPCRHARLKRVHWAADGTPILKMTYEEELTEEHKKVPIQVTVPNDKPASQETTITLDKTTLGIEAGQSATLKATITPNAAATWQSSDKAVADVNNGVVTAKKAGTATITATANGKSATCKVTVVSLDKKKLTLGVGEKATLKVDGTSNVSWNSSSKNATVSNGKVTAKKKGSATITAKAEGVELKCTVTVKAAPNKLILKSKKKVTIKKGKSTKIKVSLPKNTKGELKYKSSKKKVATVDAKGVVKGKKKGTAKITVTAANNKKAKVTVTVTVK